MKIRILAGSFALLLAATSAFAVTDTWDGGGADDNLSTALNWVDNTAPVSDLVNTDLIFAGAVELSPIVSANFSAHSVTVNNTASAFTILGSSPVLTIGTGGIVNNNTQVQTFTNLVSVGTVTSNFNAASGDLAFTELLSVPSGSTLTLSGGNLFSFNGFDGTGTVTKSGAGPMSYDPTAVAQQVDLIINTGMVTTTDDGSFSSLASIAVNGTSTLVINGDFTLNGATLTRASGATIFQGIPGKALNVDSGGSITIAGTHAPTSGSITTVSGAGSTFSVSTTLTLGGSAVLNVQNGGQFTANNVTLNANGTLNIDGGTVNLGGTFQQNGGVLNFTAGSLSFAGGLVVDSAGLLGPNLALSANRQLTVPGTTTVSAFQTLTLDGGSLSTGTLVNTGTFAFNKGTLTITSILGLNIGTGALGSNVTLDPGMNLIVTNATGVNSGATLRIDGGSFSSAPITNNGTIDHRAGAFSFTGTLANNSGGRVFIADTMSAAASITNNGTITLQNGTGQISGAGTLNNNGLVTGDGTISTPVTNASAGQIRAEAGKTIYFNGAFAANAGELYLQGGTLDFAGAITNSATGFIAGRGALYTGGLTNNGQMAFSGDTADIHGDVTLTAGSRVVTSGAGSVTTFFDDVVHNGLEIFTGVNASTVFFGSQSGAGPFTGTGTVYNNGDLRPGNSAANVSYGGDLVFRGAASLTLEIGGTTPGSQYDRLSIAGSASLDGFLDVSLINGFTPSGGQQFTILTAGSIVNNGFVLTGSAASSFSLFVSSTSVILQAIGLAGD